MSLRAEKGGLQKKKERSSGIQYSRKEKVHTFNANFLASVSDKIRK